jgi:midasin
VRDLLSWAGFINATSPQLGLLPAYAHGAHLVLLDGIGLGVGLSAEVRAAVLGGVNGGMLPCEGRSA